ncbi:MAG: ATP-binding protein [Caldimonas sp.]
MQSNLAETHSAARARIAASYAPALIWMCGTDRQLDWFNTAWESYTGRTQDELNGDGWLDLVHPEDVERCKGILATSFDARQPYTLDYRLRRHDGQYRWLLDNGVPRFEADGTWAGYIGSGIDIDERKQSEERLAARVQAFRLAERRQIRFLSLLSHELRNPLAPIANAASVLQTLEQRNPVLVRLREILERQVERLSRLAELVDGTRSAQGQVSLVGERVGVDAVVRGAADACAAALQSAGHTLEIELPAERLHVKGDLPRLTQALSNIVANAVKYTRAPGAISIAVHGDVDTVEIEVCDPGQGIAPEFLPHVFELFAQQEPAAALAPGALGVGLTLARRIARLHNGDITAQSDGVGRGARFVLKLPRIEVDADSAAPSDQPQLSESYRVLIIEDDADAREALRLQMEMWGNEVRVAGNGEEGLRIADQFKPQIVLCDIGLPGLDGFAMLAPLRAKLQGQRALFAAVTGHSQLDHEARALAVGYDSFLVKPLQPGSLARLLHSYANARVAG